MQEDILRNVDALPRLLNNGKLRFVTQYVFFLVILCEVIVCFILFTTYNLKFWQHYSPGVLGSFTILTAYSTFIYISTKRKGLDEMLSGMKFYRKLNDEDIKPLKLQAKLAEIWTASTIVVVLLTNVVCLPVYGDEYDIALPIKLAIDYCGEWSAVIIVFIYAHCYYVVLVVTANGCTLLHVILHLKFHIYYLNKQLEKLTRFCNTFAGAELIRNVKFQDDIFKKLVTCVKLHELVGRCGNRINNAIYYPIFGFTIAGTMTLVSVLFVLQGSIEIKAEGYGRFALISLYCLMVTGIFVSLGQALEMESERIFDSVRNLPWYYYNTKNRRLVLILMVKSQYSLILSASGIININYRLLISLFRSVYSIITFLWRM